MDWKLEPGEKSGRYTESRASSEFEVFGSVSGCSVWLGWNCEFEVARRSNSDSSIRSQQVCLLATPPAIAEQRYRYEIDLVHRSHRHLLSPPLKTHTSPIMPKYVFSTRTIAGASVAHKGVVNSTQSSTNIQQPSSPAFNNMAVSHIESTIEASQTVAVEQQTSGAR